MEQEELNRQFKDRIATLEIHEQVFLSMLVALIRTHPHPETFQKLFDAHVEALRARLMGEPIPDKLLDEIELLHDMLTKAFQLNNPKLRP
ncbi:MAG: hypothetical protein H0X02_08850 [Nitrosomonas sp.]|nr:hypothetical protein [Nitrosomonas sp.]